MRVVFFFLLLILVPSCLFPQPGVYDPAFNRVPFDEWLLGRAETAMRWTLRVNPPSLTWNQRLLVELESQIDGKELARRSGNGQLIVFFQMEDSAGVRYRNHSNLDLSRLHEGAKVDYLSCKQLLFIRPGDYRASVVIFDPVSREHSARRLKFRVPGLKKDPLPQLWQSLPPVQFLRSSEPPEFWFQPELPERLYLPVAPRRPLKIDVLANLTPSERLSASLRIRDRNLSILIPSLKVLSQLECTGSTMNLALMDLARRKVTFQQADVRTLDWSRMKDSFAAADPSTIDVKSLENRSLGAAFFVKQVQKRIAPSHAVIVLSRPVEFVTRQDVGLPDPPGTEDFRLYYIRLMPPPPPVHLPPLDGLRPGRRRRGIGLRHTPGGLDIFDRMVPLLAPLEPRVFDVETPGQFRKALAAILADIVRM